MHAAVGAKQGPGGTGEPKERSVLENVPPWGRDLPAVGLCGSSSPTPDFLRSKGKKKGPCSLCL